MLRYGTIDRNIHGGGNEEARSESCSGSLSGDSSDDIFEDIDMEQRKGGGAGENGLPEIECFVSLFKK